MGEQQAKAMSPTATLEIAGLNDYVTPVGAEEPIILRDAPEPPETDAKKGKPRPAAEQFTVGNILCGLVSALEPPQDRPHMVMLHREACKRIRAAMKAGGKLVAGEALLGILREALKGNQRRDGRVVYPPSLLPDVWERVGAGDLPALPDLGEGKAKA